MFMKPTTPVRGVVSVRADATTAKGLIEALNKGFEEFKVANDARVKGIEKKFDDVVQNEKVEKINNTLSELTKELDTMNTSMAALKLGAAGNLPDPDAVEHRTAFNKFFRRGVDAGLKDLEVKAKLTTQDDPDGGFVVPEEMETTIDRVLGTESAIRGLATVRSIGTSTYKKLVSMGGATSGWVGEEEARPETDTPKLREIAIEAMELYANPATTQTLLDDARFDVEQWLADEVSIEFAEQEGAAFVDGSGVKKPRGLLQYPTVANASYAWGKLGFVTSGKAAGFADTNAADALIDLYYALKSGHRNGATWLLSDKVMGTVRKFKDGDGNYLWAPPTGVDMPATVLGKPTVTDDNMPAVAANAFPVAFGDFRRTYLIVDRFGIRILRDPYTNKPFVSFYTTKRVGGGVVNFEAMKLLKIAA